jgi:hypothetical protein
MLVLVKKDYIMLEDIARFLNMETGTLHHNYYIYLIFQRIKSQR